MPLGDSRSVGNFIYKVVAVKDATPDAYGAVPYVVEQYNLTDCEINKTISISVSEEENTEATNKVSRIYNDFGVMAKTKVAYEEKEKARDEMYAEKQSNKKEAAELSKEFLINFPEVGTTFGFSLKTIQGRDITNLPYTKKYLSHLQGNVTALGQFNTCGTSKILVIAVQNGNTTKFKFLRLHYEGVYQATKDIDQVSISGNLITENLTISMVQNSYTVKADIMREYLASGNKKSTIVFAPCAGKW
jgi:hypothetical protein